MKHVVALSGGKDSTAMALGLKELEPRDYLYVCTPTGNEPEEMETHWTVLAQLLGSEIIRLAPYGERGLEKLIELENALPNYRMRWCTRRLKIEPFAIFLQALGECTSYVGIRADELEREGGDYAKVPGVRMDFPLRRWGWHLKDVQSYLAQRQIEIPRRTDCKLCFFQRISEWWTLWRDDAVGWSRGEQLEQETGHTFRTPGKDSWPVSMRAMRAAFEKGWVPRGAGQESLFKLKCRVCRL